MTYDRLRLLWPDHLGLARGKHLHREQAGRDRYQRWTTDRELNEYLPFL